MQLILIDFIKKLPENHYLNIIAFDVSYYKLFSKPRISNQINKSKALKFVKDFNASNGTEMLAPIYEAIFEKYPLQNDHQIVLMTDGAIAYEKEAIGLVHEHIGEKRFHTVGIGNSPNSYLVKGLSKSGRGSFIYVDSFTFEEKTNELLFKINHPVIKNLRIFMENDHELLPAKLPDVIADEPISFFIKVKDTTKNEIVYPIKLGGNTSLGDEWSFVINKNDIKNGKNINQLWAREKIDKIMFLNAIGSIDINTYKRRIIDIALKNNLVTKFTSLVAIDDVISRSDNQTINSFQLPHNLPEGWVDPNLLISNQKEDLNMFMNELYEVNLDTMPSLKVHFVQTDTNKNFYLVLALLLLLTVIFLFKLRKQLD
tara:strand:- start:200 stop:1312 length:1113 start_codon:yes stop_codon:yes gene_type:complete